MIGWIAKLASGAAGLGSGLWMVVVAALCGALAVAGLGIKLKNDRIDSLTTYLSECQASLTVERDKLKQCFADVRGWEGKVGEQNAAIQKLKAEATARAQEAARLLARARAAAITAELKVKDLEARLAAPTPAGADARQAVLEVRAQLDKEGGL